MYASVYEREIETETEIETEVEKGKDWAQKTGRNSRRSRNRKVKAKKIGAQRHRQY